MWKLQPFALVVLMHCYVALLELTFGCKVIRKCCRKGEWLDFKEDKCKQIPGRNVDFVDEEQIDISDTQNISQREEFDLWWPRSPFASTNISCVSVIYSIRSSSEWNMKFDTDVITLETGDDIKDVLIKQGRNSLVAEGHCFDAVAGGRPYKRVLRAIIRGVKKCCRKGSFFSANYDMCVPWEDAEIEQDLDFEQIYLSPNDSNSYFQWLPNKLRESSNRKNVFYDFNWKIGHTIFSAEADEGNAWILEDSTEKFGTLVMKMKFRSGKAEVIRTVDFCFETVRGKSLKKQAIIGYSPDIPGLPKCCSVFEYLTSRGTCEEYPDDGSFSFRQSMLLNKPVLFNSVGLQYSTKYEIIADITLFFNSDEIVVVKNSLYKIACIDLLRSNNGVERDVLAYSILSPSGPWYQNVRPLQVLAAVFLVAGVVIVLSSKDSRSNIHSIALAIHASCLAVSNILQMTWFFNFGRVEQEDCKDYRYSVYFFMMAGACWLNAMAVNMAHGCRRPIGALARGGSGGWERLAVISIYAWGVPAALTALAVLMDSRSLEEKGYITPSFLETRTCKADLHHGNLDDSPRVSSQGLGSFFYYYLPSALLVIANIVCVILTLCTIKTLRDDSSLLQSDHPLRSTLLYVKLLLCAGVLELAVEAIAWGVRHFILAKYASWSGPSFYMIFHLMDTFLIFGVVLTFVELARAAAVLWLCVGRWGRVVAAWRWLRGRLPWRRKDEPPPPLALEATPQGAFFLEGEHTKL